MGWPGKSGYEPDHGERKQPSRRFHGAARVVDQALRDSVDEHAPSRSDGVGATFSQLLDLWLESVSGWTPRPPRSVLTVLRSSGPSGRILAKVTTTRRTARNFDALYGAMKDAGKSPKTIRNHHTIISTALRQAVRWGWVRTNVAEMAKSRGATSLR